MNDRRQVPGRRLHPQVFSTRGPLPATQRLARDRRAAPPNITTIEPVVLGGGGCRPAEGVRCADRRCPICYGGYRQTCKLAGASGRCADPRCPICVGRP